MLGPCPILIFLDIAGTAAERGHVRPEQSFRLCGILEAVLEELQKRCPDNHPANVRIATVYYKPLRNRSRLVPDYYVHATEQWLVFPHELVGLSAEEIRAHKPASAQPRD